METKWTHKGGSWFFVLTVHEHEGFNCTDLSAALHSCFTPAPTCLYMPARACVLRSHAHAAAHLEREAEQQRDVEGGPLELSVSAFGNLILREHCEGCN